LNSHHMSETECSLFFGGFCRWAWLLPFLCVIIQQTLLNIVCSKLW